MKTLKRINVEMVLPILVAWFLMTVLVDMVAIPAVFRNSSSILDAGKIGMIVFSRFNFFEVVFGLIVLLGALANVSLLKNKKWLYFVIPLVILSLIYKFHMTPMITNTTWEIQKTDRLDPLYGVLQAQHAYYHNLYKYCDTAKLVYLLVFIGIVITDKIKPHKEQI